MPAVSQTGTEKGWVKIEFSKSALKKHGDFGGVLRNVPVASAWVLTMHIKRRGMRGDAAGQTAAPYPGRVQRTDKGARGMRWTGKEYKPRGARKLKDVDGFVLYASSKDLHAGTRPNSFDVTGGMWDGLSVVAQVRQAKIAFRGRSVGQQTSVKFFKRKGRRVKSLKVNNALKAWTVINKKGVNILALKKEELQAIGDGIVMAAPLSIINAGPANIQWQRTTSSSTLALAFSKAIVTGRGR